MKKIFILLLIIILVLCLYNDQIRSKVRQVINLAIQKTVIITKDFVSKETTKGKEKLSQKKEETSKKVKKLVDKQKNQVKQKLKDVAK